MIKEECPLLQRCLEVANIDCKGRDFSQCDLFRSAYRDKLPKKARKKTEKTEAEKLEDYTQSLILDYGEGELVHE